MKVVNIKGNSRKYLKFLYEQEYSMINYSNKYLDMLGNIIENTEKNIISVQKENKILGIFPLIIKFNKSYGNVINSLPYFGSVGGILLDKALNDIQKEKVLNLFFKKLNEVEKEYNCISTCIISSVFENQIDYEKYYESNFTDKRVGQYVELPEKNNNLRKILFYDYFSGSLRRNIRKAEEKKILIKECNSWEEMEKFYEIHKDNMLAINGNPKPKSMFKYIYSNFEADKDFKLLMAVKDDKIISGLLLMYFNKIVEYYTPAIVKEYRSMQPNCLLIYNSMLEAIEKGYKIYNFGGTHKSQKGLYRFKKKWGTVNRKYKYYIKTHKELKYFKKIGTKKLKDNYRYFYALPFSELG